MRNVVALIAASSGPGALADSAPLCSSGTFDESIAACSEVIRGNAQASWAYVKRGGGYINKVDYDNAIADETKAIEINPRYGNRSLFGERGILIREVENLVEQIKRAG
jgi:tetratricopeptide (TPR) repeat protein